MIRSHPKSNRASTRSGKSRHVIGIDFGTLSGRAVLVEADTGREIASVVHDYRHGVIEDALPGSRRRLAPQTALQDPADYLDVLRFAIPKLLRAARIRPDQVVGLGTDFTCCTVLPTRRDGTPLCFDRRWRNNPHAWVKLWKHHAAQPEADLINQVGQTRSESFIEAYGGRYSSEWLFSKVLETLRAAPAVYQAADRFIEAGDWIVWQLCGAEKRSLSAAGFKAMWVHAAGTQGAVDATGARPDFPPNAFFKALDPRLEHVVEEKLGRDFHPLGSCAGGLTPEMARLTGLRPGTPVCVGNIDAHVAVPACSVTRPGRLVMIMGTSTCHLLLGETRQPVEGICGVVEHGVVPGLWGYEAGQAGVGDLFAWFVDRAVPAAVAQAARRAGTSVHDVLAADAARLAPGESGLLALDWWNGNRSVLVDATLTGLLLGSTLATQPHEIYRTLIEATAFGTRRIIEAFTTQGIAIDELHACGGLAQKSPLIMQIYADVTGRPIKVAAAEQASALGAAMFATVAAGVHRDIHAAARRMVQPSRTIYRPNPRAHTIYDELYAIYLRMHDLFGRDPQSPMKELRRIQAGARRTIAKRTE